MNWTKLESTEQLDHLASASSQKPILIFKHSTRCSISSMALSRLERNWKEEDDELIDTYILDLIEHRNVSNEIEKKFGVLHESPQVLVIKNEKCAYDNSHMSINYGEIKQTIEA